MTVEVHTPAGPRNGRGVVETRARERNEVLYTLDSAQLIVHGEAIAVALPTGLLVAPISNREYGFFSLTGRSGDAFYARRDSFRERERAAIAGKRSFDLLPEGWPAFIFFPDPSDPRSAEEVPQADDLSVAGTGFKVRRIGVQETDAPITRTIEATLPWLTTLPTSGARISGRTDHIAPDRILPTACGAASSPPSMRARSRRRASQPRHVATIHHTLPNTLPHRGGATEFLTHELM